MTGVKFIEKLQIEAQRRSTPDLSVQTGLPTDAIEAFKHGAHTGASTLLIFMDALGYQIIDFNGNPVSFVTAGIDYED